MPCLFVWWFIHRRRVLNFIFILSFDFFIGVHCAMVDQIRDGGCDDDHDRHMNTPCLQGCGELAIPDGVDGLIRGQGDEAVVFGDRFRGGLKV